MRNLSRGFLTVLLVSMAALSAQAQLDSGIDNIWYNGSIPGWAASPIDPNNVETLALAASGPESVFAIQQAGGVTQLVQIVWNAGAGAWLREVIDVGNAGKIYLDIANDNAQRDSVFAIIDDGTGTTDLFLVWHKTNEGWQVSDLSLEDNNVEVYKSLAMDPRRESVWCAREGSLWSTRWNTFDKIWDVGANNWINQNTYVALADNNDPSPINTDPNFYDQVFGRWKEGDYMPSAGRTNWHTGEINADREYIALASDQPDSIWGVNAAGGLDNYYWSAGLGYWVYNQISGANYIDVAADRPDVIWAARADGSLEQIFWNGSAWQIETISVKYHPAVSNAFSTDSTSGTDSLFAAVGDLTPVCGDFLHPYPEFDFDQDCLVGLSDFAIFAGNWMVDNRP